MYGRPYGMTGSPISCHCRGQTVSQAIFTRRLFHWRLLFSRLSWPCLAALLSVIYIKISEWWTLFHLPLRWGQRRRWPFSLDNVGRRRKFGQMRRQVALGTLHFSRFHKSGSSICNCCLIFFFFSFWFFSHNTFLEFGIF